MHDFVLNINRKVYASREFNDSNSIHTNLETYACTPVFFLCYPKAYNSLKPIKNGYVKSKTKGAQKETLLYNVHANICGINKLNWLKWPRCLNLLKKILNLEVFKKMSKTKKSLIYRLLVDVVLYQGSLFLSSDSKPVQVC